MHEKWYLKFRSDFLDQMKTLITENIEKDEQRSLLRQQKSQLLNDLAHKLAVTEEWYIYHTRQALLDKVIIEKMSEWNLEMKTFGSVYYIKSKTMEIFNQEYKAGHEVVFAERLRTLKTTDPKLAKTKIIGQMKITDKLYEILLNI
jgi:hypothetical protein